MPVRLRLFAVVGVALLVGCARPPLRSETPVTVPADSRRLLFEPEDVGFVATRSHAPAGDGAPLVARLGGADEGSVVLLRFAVELPPDAQILQAFVVLEKASATDGVPAPLALYAYRITEPWSGATVTWARRPRVERAAGRGYLAPGAGPLVRIDVRDVVARWALRRRDDFGVAVEAQGDGVRPGVPFALGTVRQSREHVDPILGPLLAESVVAMGPRLELYLK